MYWGEEYNDLMQQIEMRGRLFPPIDETEKRYNEQRYKERQRWPSINPNRKKRVNSICINYSSADAYSHIAHYMELKVSLPKDIIIRNHRRRHVS